MIEVGDSVTLVSDPTFQGTLVKLPRSIGRKRARALVTSTLGEQWVFLDELRPAQTPDVASSP